MSAKGAKRQLLLRDEELDVVGDGGRMFEREARAAIRHVPDHALDRSTAIVVVERPFEKRSLPDSYIRFFGHRSPV